MKRDIEAIKLRNTKVEADKAWEVSLTRRSVIAILTYFIVVLFLCMIDAPNPWLSALVPVAGFILSTLTLTFIKKYWLNNCYKKLK